MSQPAEAMMLTITARAPFHVYFEGQAVSLTGYNSVGPFDILPGHADFFSMLEPCEISIDEGNGKEPTVFEINNGIITVRDDHVMLFANM